MVFAATLTEVTPSETVNPASLFELSLQERSISLEDTPAAIKPLGATGLGFEVGVGVGVTVAVGVGVGVALGVTVGEGVGVGV